MANNITFYTGTLNEYQSLARKDANGIYFLKNQEESVGRIYKGDELYSGSELYAATKNTLGGIKVGDDFEMLDDGTLSIYHAIGISKFSNSTSQNEIGSSITSSTFSWKTNKTPTSLTISGRNLSEKTLQNIDSGNQSITFDSPIVSDTDFTLVARDNRNATSLKTSIKFYHKIYYGVSKDVNITNAFILSLSGVLAANRVRSFSVNANNDQYIYVAIPASFGIPQFYVGGFEGGFNQVKTFDFKNISGNTSSYNVYKSTNSNLGQTTVEVK